MAWSRGKKILVGCLVAVALAVLAFIAVIVLFVSWLRTPGPELEGRTLITADTGFYFRLRLPEEDQAVRELVRVWARSQNRLDGNVDLEKLPPMLRALMPMLGQLGEREVPDEELDKMLPVQLIVTAPRHAEGDPPLLFAFNAPGMGNSLRLADWILGRVSAGDSDLESRLHGEERLYRLGDDMKVWVCIAGTDILVATDPGTLAAGLDRVAAAAGPGADPGMVVPPDLAEALVPLPAGAPLQVAATAGMTTPLTDVILERPAPALARLLRTRIEGARALSGWARLEDAHRLSGRLLVSGGADDPGGGTVWTLEFLDGSVALQVADAGMNVDGQRVFDLELTGMRALVEWGAGRLSSPGFRIDGGP